jgi:hypothetical protein
MQDPARRNDVLRCALAEAQKRVGLGGQDGEGIRELASVCVRSDPGDGVAHTRKKKRGNPYDDDLTISTAKNMTASPSR